MRTFSSYGPVDTDAHFYVPRHALVNEVLRGLVGENPSAGGGYITVWAPRQRGKSWIVGQALRRLRSEAAFRMFDVAAMSVERLAAVDDPAVAARRIAGAIARSLGSDEPPLGSPDELEALFRRDRLVKPLILVLDEFDALPDPVVEAIVRVFRNIHGERVLHAGTAAERGHLLHGVALVGVRSVLGVDAPSGSPFNVQRSVHVPNLSLDETRQLFAWYGRETGRAVQDAVVEAIYRETAGHPGLTSWLGELLDKAGGDQATVGIEDFDAVYAEAVDALPNATVQNLIAKVARSPYRDAVLDLFETDGTRRFRFDEPNINFLYTNGVIDRDLEGGTRPGQAAVKFSCPFVQKRLFSYFSSTLFDYSGQPYGAFEDLADTLTQAGLNVRQLIRRFEAHLRRNAHWLLKDAPRRADLRVYEAVHHFLFYAFLLRFLERKGSVLPEFPTGNGKIDLVIRYDGKDYGIEVKTFTDASGYHRAVAQAARYGQQLGVAEITLALFVDSIDAPTRETYERPHKDADTGVTVAPTFVETASTSPHRN